MKFLEKFKLVILQKILKLNTVHYINGSETLPPPLTKEEEKEAFIIFGKSSSDDPEVKNAKNKIITHNIRLAVYIAKKFESTGVGIEDLSSIGTIGLIKAVNTFSLEKNIKFATYASRCIENEILMYLRKSSQYKNELSIDEPLHVDGEGNELRLADIIGTDDDIVHKRVDAQAECDAVQQAVDTLGEREKQIVQMRFGLIKGQRAKTQKEVADEMGISQSYISRIEKKIIVKLKEELINNV
jgi:RNA polymerase sporulation-specific sigma factor